MLEAPSEFIIVFIIISVTLILGMAVFISLIIYRYQQKQNTYFRDIETLKTAHQNTLLQTQVEIQEQTFQNISREIHDNIGQKLNLAKVYLTTVHFANAQKTGLQVNDAFNIIGEVIKDLSDLSRSMSSEIILKYGLIEALKSETEHLSKTGLFTIHFSATGNTVSMNTDTELVVFRMVQEALNNIVKHAAAAVIDINLHYTSNGLIVQVCDDGKGFNTAEPRPGNGLQNIKKRAGILKGNATINSQINAGTKIKIEIPLYGNNKAL